MTRTEIAVLGFYDGATEGFARRVGETGPCYFKLLAWDDGQDARLFAVVSVRGSDLEASVEELIGLPGTGGRILPPARGTEGDSTRALVSRCHARIEVAGFLVLGWHVDEPSARVIPIQESVREAVQRALRESEPGDLREWLDQVEAGPTRRPR